MKRASGGAIAATVAGLVVVAVGLWAQVRSLNDGQPEPPGVLVAVLDRPTEANGWGLVVLDSRAPGEEIVLAEGSDRLAGIPAWSPDGKRLAWIQMDTEQAEDDDEEAIPLEEVTADLVIWDRERGTRHMGTIRLVGISQLAWSPDSRVVAGIGEPFQLWNRDARLLAVGYDDNSNSTSGGGAWQPWAPDGRRVAYFQEGRLFHYDLTSGHRDLWAPSELGLPPRREGYMSPGWTGPDTLIVFAAGPSREAFEVDLARGTASQSTRSFEEFFAGLELTGPLRDTVAGLQGPERPRAFGKTVDGRGEYAALIAASGSEVSSARLLVEAGGEIAEFTFSAGDPIFRNQSLSVVLVGGWPEGGSR